MQIEISKLKEIISHTSFKKHGHVKEKNFGHILATSFPNCEFFWKNFIVPFTNRLDNSIFDDDDKLKIDPRENTSADFHEIGSYHYSIFLNFLYAYNALEEKQISFFENFYTHLGSVCDSVEEFLTKIYFIILECTNQQTVILQKLTKDGFLKIADGWYDKYYDSAFEHYLSKGKPPPIKLPSRQNILDEYLHGFADWKEYKRISRLVREYRNVIVHNYQIAYIPHDGKSYVPKKEKIQQYKKWRTVGNSVGNQPNFDRDFIVRELQMNQDIEELQKVLNRLWVRPIVDMNKLLFIQKNDRLLLKYDLSFV